jgi:hypothetical protein
MQHGALRPIRRAHGWQAQGKKPEPQSLGGQRIRNGAGLVSIERRAPLAVSAIQHRNCYSLLYKFSPFNFLE